MPKRPPARKKEQLVKTKPIVYVFVIFVVIILGLSLFKPQKPNLPVTPSFPDIRTFRSSILDFTIEVPHGFEISEKVGGLVKINNSKGTIYIDRHSTNFTNIADYFINLDNLNKTNISEEVNATINSYEVRIRVINLNSGKTQKVYTYYIDHKIYSIFTEDEDMYSDLNKIAQSFRYTPD